MNIIDIRRNHKKSLSHEASRASRSRARHFTMAKPTNLTPTLLRSIWFRVAVLLALIIIQSQLPARAGVAIKDVSTVNRGSLSFPVRGFDSHSCGDLDYQSMKLDKTDPPRDPCSFFKGSRVYVSTLSRRLYLCDRQVTVGKYDVATGQAGFDKHRDRDNRTPIGTYSLTPARLSTRFGIFILVGYPTQEQIENGDTGDSIGIHGPERPNECEGIQNVQRNWTEGCLAVTNDVFIEEIAAFVLKHPGVKISIQ